MPRGNYKHKKGYKLSIEHKKRISLSMYGKAKTLEHRLKAAKASGLARKGLINNFLGKKHSPESKQKIRLSRLGKASGEKHWHWKGGITSINVKIRTSVEYKLWRIAVFQRDNYTCIWCGQVGGKLNADHIKPFALFPELRLAIDNGRTLCVDCHKTTESFGRTKLT